jgi:hypothetical protein
MLKISLFYSHVIKVEDVFLGGFADNRLIVMAVRLFGSAYSAWCGSDRYHVALTPCRAVGALCAESARSVRLIREREAD